MKKNLLILIIFLNSCQFFVDEQLTEKQILEKRIAAIDWSKVDVMPSFSQCDLLETDSEQNKCFFDFLNQNILEKLKKDNYVSKFDSIKIQVKLDKNGNFEFFDSSKNPKLDSVFKLKLDNFPRASPAVKQGIYVKTEFNLDIKLKQ